MSNVTNNVTFKTLRGRTVTVKPLKEGALRANSANIIKPKIEVPNGILVVLDNYLFPDEQAIKPNVSKPKLDGGMLSVVTAPTKEEPQKVNDNKEESKSETKTSFIEDVQQVLSFLKSGVRVFQHFLANSNVSKMLGDGKFSILFFSQ